MVEGISSTIVEMMTFCFLLSSINFEAICFFFQILAYSDIQISRKMRQCFANNALPRRRKNRRLCVIIVILIFYTAHAYVSVIF